MIDQGFDESLLFEIKECVTRTRARGCGGSGRLTLCQGRLRQCRARRDGTAGDCAFQEFTPVQSAFFHDVSLGGWWRLKGEMLVFLSMLATPRGFCNARERAGISCAFGTAPRERCHVSSLTFTHLLFTRLPK